MKLDIEQLKSEFKKWTKYAKPV